MINVKRRRRTRSFSNGGIERRCWSDLPSDLMEPIMSKLFFADQINVRAVCKSWHSLDRVPPLKQMPWLMVFDDIEGKHSWDSCKLADPTYKKTYTIDMSCINKKKNLKDSRVKIHESKYGWLLMSCLSSKTPTSTSTLSLFLYSPFFIDNNIIELPVLNTLPCNATFDLNLTKHGEEDFEVLILYNSIDSTHIGTCRPRDKSWCWNKIALRINIPDNWVYSEGIFYYVSWLGSEYGCYNIVRNSWTRLPAFVPKGPIIDIVVHHGEIFLISISNWLGQCWGSMNGYVYKLDCSKGTWESIPNLGDRALFVGDGYSSILELDDGIDELKNQKEKVYSCYSSMLKHFNTLGETKSYSCWKQYGWLGQGKLCRRRIWIDPPRRPHIITNSL